MSKIDYAFRKWTKGEISQQISGRDDTEMYYSSAADLQNSLVRPYGNVVNRGGSHFVAEVKVSAEEVRLLKFVVDADTAYIVEMGIDYFRFFANSGRLLKDETDADVLGPWATPIDYVKGTFLLEGGSLYHCIDDHTSGASFGADAAHWHLQTETSSGSNIWIVEVPHTYATDELWDLDDAQKDDILNIVHELHAQARLIRKSSDEFYLEDFSITTMPFEELNADAAKTVTYAAITGDGITITSNFDLFNTDAPSTDLGRPLRIWGDKNDDGEVGYVEIATVVGAQEATADVINTLFFKPGVSLPYTTKDWAWGAWYEDNYPQTVTYYEDRLAFAGTPAERFGVWLSKNFIYDDFELGKDADDAISQVVNAERANAIKWMSSGHNLAIGTFGDEFIIGAGADVGLTFANANARRQGGVGSKRIRPIKMGDFLYYVQRGGRKVREFFYRWEENNYKSIDMTKYAEHITYSGITDIDCSFIPDEILYCTLGNGKMAVLTRDPEEEVQAWTPFITDGEYKSVRVIPNPDGKIDQVWVIVERVIDGSTYKYIEWFENYVVDDETIQRELFYVDSGLTYDGYTATAGITVTLGAITGAGVSVAASGGTPFSSGDVGQRIRAIDATTKLMVGELTITAYTSTSVVTGTVTENFPSVTLTPTNWALSVSSISGFSHIEGEEVSILGDGAVQNNDDRKTVTSGVITLGKNAFYVAAGLPYISKLKTNPFEYPSGGQSTRIIKKRISSVGVKVYKTLGITYSDGISGSNTPEVEYRQAQTESGLPEELYTGVYPNLSLDGDWGYDNQVEIKQTNPLPMNILAIYTNVRTGDKR